ncbi:MAG: tetratricopeptide repeat protein [bacterium]|nr:MAG: tetratricopeptide repeat protein [bacterium]
MDAFTRFLSVLLLGIFLALSLFAEAIAYTEIFPLGPGNTWTYRDLDGELETLVISRFVEKNGIPLVEAYYDGASPFYYILSAEGVFRLQPASGTTLKDLRGNLTMLLQWPLEPGQSWQSSWSDPPLSFTVLDRGPVKVAAGNFHDSIKIGYRPVSSPIYQGYIWFEPGVGLLAQEENNNRTELFSYSLSDLLSPPEMTISGDKLARIFQSPGSVAENGATGTLSRLKELLPSVQFSLFLLLAFAAFIALVVYLNSGKVEMDLKDDPDVQEGEATLASAMVREGLYEDAAAILQRLTAKHPQWPDLAALLGRAYRETGKLPEACLELKRALTLNPDLSKARLELVKTYLGLNEPARALDEVETVLSVHQGFADAVYLKGEVLSAMGNNDQALEYFREALKINPSFNEAQKALERLLAEEEG